MAGLYLAMKFVGQHTNLVDIAIALGPNLNCLRHVAKAPEMAEDKGQVLHIIGTVAALNQALTHQLHVGIGKLQLEPGLLVADWHRDLTQVLLEVRLVAALAIFCKAEDGPFFRLGPQTLSADVSSNTAQNLCPEHAQREHADHNGDEHANDHQQSFCDRQAL